MANLLFVFFRNHRLPTSPRSDTFFFPFLCSVLTLVVVRTASGAALSASCTPAAAVLYCCPLSGARFWPVLPLFHSEVRAVAPAFYPSVKLFHFGLSTTYVTTFAQSPSPPTPPHPLRPRSPFPPPRLTIPPPGRKPKEYCDPAPETMSNGIAYPDVLSNVDMPGSSIPAAAPGYRLGITVCDPVKQDQGMNAYITYKVWYDT